MKRHRQYILFSTVVLSIGLIAACGGPSDKKQPAGNEAAATAPAATPAPAPIQTPPVAAAPPETKAPTPKVAAKVSNKPAIKPATAQVSAPVPVATRPSEPTPQLPPDSILSSQVVTPTVLPPPPPPPEPVIRKVTIPSGTLLDLRMIDSINSDTDHVGQVFKASLASPLTVDQETIIPKGADVYVKLAEVKAAGNMAGTSQLKVQLDRIFVGKRSYLVESNTYVQTGSNQTVKTAKTVGIGSAIGAAIGAIAGGKKGAAIGAGVGAGSGAVIEGATKGEQVRIASESALTFRLEAPIEVTLSPEDSPSPKARPIP